MEKFRAPEESFTKVSFYVVAHADDWQLFMCPNVYMDLIAPKHKVVFIITTAGDAGTDKEFWSAREEGLKSSVRFCLAPLSGIVESSGVRQFNHHTINYWSANNTISYFLRLPDGNLDGNGFATYSYKSLYKFATGHVHVINSVDNSATYNNWQDLCETLQQIIQYEGFGISDVWINYLNPDTNANPRDHADHIATGQLIQAMPIATALPQKLYVGYNSRNMPGELHPIVLFWKTGMFAAYEKAVFDGSNYSTLHEDIGNYVEWCQRCAHYITVNP